MSAKICSVYFTVFELAFWRSLFGVICIALLMIHRGIPFPTKYPLSHLKRCVAGVCCFFLEIVALSYLPLSVEQPIIYLSPLFFCFFFVVSYRYAGKPIEWPIIGAVVLGFIGVLLIAHPTSETFNAIGVAFALAAAFLGACSNWFLRSLGQQGEPEERAVFYFMLTGLVAGIVGMIFSPEPIHLPQTKWILPLLGVMTTGLLGQVLMTYAWAKGHSLLNAVFQFAGIFFGVVVGIVAFRENPDSTALFGVVIIFAAGLFSSLYLRKKR